MQVTLLSVSEISGFLHSFEKKYGISTQEFLCDSSRRAKISEDDIFEWEAFADHLNEIKRLEDELRRAYLANLRHQSSGAPQMLTPEEQILLAA
jgi:hypothetical protein